MARLPSWLPSLLDRINWGLTNSPLLKSLSDGSDILDTGRIICLDLWPFIEKLPVNIAKVRESLPAEMESARNLLDKLADDERHFQGLFKKQCALAGLSEEDINNHEQSKQSKALCAALDRFVQNGSYRDGIYAITAAELAATAFARSSLPKFESYFADQKNSYSKERVEEGLAWLRLHVEPQTRQARWLTKMLCDIRNGDGKDLPEPVAAIIDAVYGFWRLTDSGSLSEDDEASELNF